MNTAQHATPTFLLDQDWVEVVSDTLASPAVTFAVEPQVMGMYDAQMGRPMQPEAYYRTVVDCHAYIIAYKEMTEIWAAMLGSVNDGALQAMVDRGNAVAAAEDDWKRYDHADYDALAAYYDEIATGGNN